MHISSVPHFQRSTGVQSRSWAKLEAFQEANCKGTSSMSGIHRVYLQNHGMPIHKIKLLTAADKFRNNVRFMGGVLVTHANTVTCILIRWNPSRKRKPNGNSTKKIIVTETYKPRTLHRFQIWSHVRCGWLELRSRDTNWTNHQTFQVGISPGSTEPNRNSKSPWDFNCEFKFCSSQNRRDTINELNYSACQFERKIREVKCSRGYGFCRSGIAFVPSANGRLA